MTALSVGTHTSCVVREGGALWCWGVGPHGTLGEQEGPGPVQVAQVDGLSNVWVGKNQVCFVANDQAQCFGDIGSRTPVTVPTPVPHLSSTRDIAVGTRTCFVDLEGGLYCRASGHIRGYRYTPDRLSNRLFAGVQAVASGDYHSCVTDGEGAVHCWGNAGQHRLGPLNVRFYTDTPRLLPDIAGVTQISIHPAGGQTCVVRGDDAPVLCWGAVSSDRGWGTLGEEPIELPPAGEPIVKVIAGLSQALAIGESGALYRYTLSDDESEADRSGSRTVHYQAPIALELPPVRDAGIGNSHTCALTREGAVLCWGLGAGGRLGTDERGTRLTPMPVQFEDPS